MQAEVPRITSDDATQNLSDGTHTVGAARTDAQHHLGAHDAANEHAEQMPVLGPGNEDVAQTDQIELHNQGVEAGDVSELLALAATARAVVQHIALVIRDGVIGAGAAVQVARVAGELRARIQLRRCEDDAGHEPGGGYFAEEDDEYGAQLPDAKVANHIGDDVAARCRRWSSGNPSTFILWAGM